MSLSTGIYSPCNKRSALNNRDHDTNETATRQHKFMFFHKDEQGIKKAVNHSGFTAQTRHIQLKNVKTISKK